MDEKKRFQEMHPDIPVFDMQKGDTLASVMDRIGESMGWHDHNMNRDRPYSGQAHTDEGERGKTEVKGITFRDLRDCFIRAVILSTGGSNYQPRTGNSIEDNKIKSRIESLYREAEKGDRAALCSDDLYGWDLDKIDPMAIAQNLSCEVERIMGIFPNIPKEKNDG